MPFEIFGEGIFPGEKNFLTDEAPEKSFLG
jgi:hypothetical protein